VRLEKDYDDILKNRSAEKAAVLFLNIMQSELTYILGAGASYESIPIVKFFPNRFNSFHNYLLSISSNPNVYEEIRNVFKEASEKAEEINTAFKTHQSFDTYFKKLFHTGEVGKISLAKKILNLYFFWEHLSKPSPKPQEYEQDIFWKQSTVDKRYDALIAGLLKPKNGKAEPYCPINFITWNYDLNLFLSLKNYFAPDVTIGEFLKTIESDKYENVWKINNKITVINMNGFFYTKTLSDEKHLTNIRKEIYDMILNKLNKNYFSINYIDKDAELIKFAWESELDPQNVVSEVVKEATKKIFLSDNIVVIGYTFPLYNRLVDFEYFNGSTLADKTIYIQDPNANELKDSLITDFNIRIDRTTGAKSSIKEFTKCDSFVVPSTIYKYKDKITEIL
jgi:hypothetical protein